MKKLLTLSATIDLYEDRLSKIEDTVPNESNSAELAILQELGITIYCLNKTLKQTLKLGDFIPCDSEGRPMSEPLKIGRGIAEEAQAEVEKAYQEALKAVIFEGWELTEWREAVNDKGNRVYSIAGSKTGVLFFDGTVGTTVFHTRADLARATASNPLTLR